VHSLQDRDIHTRKMRNCEWCGEAIEAKTLCRYRVYINEDGDFCTGYQHPECSEAMFGAPYYVADSWEIGSFHRGSDRTR